MFRKISMIVALTVAYACTSSVAQAQFGGLRVQVGGYGSGIRVGGYGYGNGFYNGYGNVYRNGYGRGYYGNPYANSFNGGYYGNGSSYTGMYPNFGYNYVGPTYYPAPIRSYPIRRFRYR